MFDYWPRNGEAVKHRSSTTCNKREKTGQTELAPQTKAIKLANQKGKQIHAVRKRACPSGLTVAEDVVRRFQANQQAQLTETLKLDAIPLPVQEQQRCVGDWFKNLAPLCQQNNQHQQQL